jgi:hypothetical protein
MGDARIKSLKQSDSFDQAVSEGFELTITKMKFEYVSEYQTWKRSVIAFNEGNSLGGLLRAVTMEVDNHLRID